MTPPISGDREELGVVPCDALPPGVIPVLARTAVSIALVVNQLNSQSTFAVIATPAIKSGAAALAAALLTLSLARSRTYAHASQLNVTGAVTVLTYYFLLGSVTAINGASMQRVGIVLQSVALMLLLVLAHAGRQDMVKIFWLSFWLQCFIAYFSSESEESSIHAISGGSHPSIVGFSAVGLVALEFELQRRIPDRTKRWTHGLLALGVAVPALFLSFNRASLLGAGAGLLAFIMIRGGIRFFYAAALGAIAAALAEASITERVVDFLAAGDRASLYTATGRTTIWARTAAVRESYLPFGLGVGVDDASAQNSSAVYQATFGAPVENSPFQALVWLGYPGLALIVALLAYGCHRIMRDFESLLARCLTIGVLISAATVTSQVAGTSLASFFLFSFCLRIGRGSMAVSACRQRDPFMPQFSGLRTLRPERRLSTAARAPLSVTPQRNTEFPIR